jgi:hypothetical protein
MDQSDIRGLGTALHLSVVEARNADGVLVDIKTNEELDTLVHGSSPRFASGPAQAHVARHTSVRNLRYWDEPLTLGEQP